MALPVSRSRLWAGAGLLLALNVFICFRLFTTEYLPHMNSIEGAYFAISRFIMDHPRDLTWFPWWYGGIPFQNSYPPLFHMLVAAAAWLFGLSPALAHHAMGAACYCLGPVALLFLAYAFSGNFRLSMAASLLYSLVSPSTFLMPSVVLDTGSVWHARRLEALVVYGDGPHICALTLLLFAMLALHLALERRGRPLPAIAAVLLLAAVAITNWIGAFSLTLAVASYLLARLDSDWRGWLRTLGFTALLGLLAYGLASPWIPPSTIADIQRNAQYTVGYYPMGLRHLGYAALLIVAAAVLYRILLRARASLCVRFSSYFLLATAALALPGEWLKINVMPQADRYHIEMEIALCLVLAFVAGPWLMRLAGKHRTWLTAAFVVGGVVQVFTYRHYAQTIVRPLDITTTVEYQASRWLQANLPGRRVFATGSIQFWLNAFSSESEIGGGFGQGVGNTEIPVVEYGIPYTEKDGADTAMWLRLLGVQAVIVSGPTTRDSYPGVWRDADKFRGVLPELWRSGGDAIYGVPQRSESLAHVVFSSDIVSKAPINVTKVELVRALGSALEDPALPLARMTWKSQHEAIIAASLQPQQLMFVQVSYHPGWHASVNGDARPITRDGLGFMVIEPRCSGPCEIRLCYDGGGEMRLAKLGAGISLLAVLLGVAWMGFLRWRRGGTGVALDGGPGFPGGSAGAIE